MHQPAIANPTAPPPRRTVILQDSLIFLILSSISIVLFSLTLLLFRAFERHREQLAVRWAAQGETDLHTGRPALAVAALRTALTYRDNLPTELQLAQALAAAGRTEEATNYFLTLRETRPGDGFINLQLARLYRQQHIPAEAINDYRAAIFGDWQGDGASRRREVRLELATYLAQVNQQAAARDELLIAAGNAPDTFANDVLFADHLQAIGDPEDALTLETKALALRPRDHATLAAAGRLALALGQDQTAYRLLSAAVETRQAHGNDTAELTTLAAEAHRLPELSLSRTLPAAERAEHLLLAVRLAQARLRNCTVALSTPETPNSETIPPSPHLSPAPPPPAALAMLRSRWLALAPQLKQRALERDAALADSVTQLVQDTEAQTVAPCGAPTGDDALLLRLATTSPAPQP